MNPEDPVDVFMITSLAAGLVTGVIALVLFLLRTPERDFCPSGEPHRWSKWQPICTKHQWRGCEKCGYSELKAM